MGKVRSEGQIQPAEALCLVREVDFIASTLLYIVKMSLKDVIRLEVQDKGETNI